MTTKICITCNKEYEPNKHSRNQKYCSKACCWKQWDANRPQSRNDYQREYKKKWMADPINRERMRELQRVWSKKQTFERRMQVIQKFGGKCMTCGFSDWRALQIDHINGGGIKEFRDLYQMGKSRSRKYYYKALLTDTSGKYQLLCANCNWIKKYERNEV